ncbi:maltose alpha-D-glucosyltransferase domain protein [Mycobacterium kansasii]|uniref:Maltose alpha-D-glucosyltransferase domain protein n=1 Tax=Mycobacterium kansasii TaxID=1768 RepID=A0A1V3W9H3_MYCKA|nr:maltose alpha-D-glucosyltransferase domain protein [Mycobacterium kansasii]
MELMNDAREASRHDPAHHPAEGSHVEGGVVEHPDAKDFGNAAAFPPTRPGSSTPSSTRYWSGFQRFQR